MNIPIINGELELVMKSSGIIRFISRYFGPKFIDSLVEFEGGSSHCVPINIPDSYIGLDIVIIEEAQRELFWYKKQYTLAKKDDTSGIKETHSRKEFHRGYSGLRFDSKFF